MSFKRKFIYNGILLTLVGFAMRGAVLFLGAYISGKIGAEGVGLQGLVATVYSFAVTFATSGVALSVTRLVAASIGEGEDSDAILRGAFLYALIFGVSACAVLFLFSDLIGGVVLADGRVASSLRILSLSLLPIAMTSVISGYFVAVRRVALNATVQILGQITRIALTVLLLSRVAEGDIADAIQALALGATLTEVACLIVALAELFLDRRIHSFKKTPGCNILKVSKMALPLAFSAYVRSFLLSVEHSLIPKRLTDRGNSRTDSLRSYGYLSGMALPIILFPMTPLSSFSGLLVPEFAECEGRGDMGRMRRMASVTMEKALAYAITVSAFILAFSEELGYVIYDTYEAGRYIGMLAPVIPIMYLDHVTDSMLKGIGEHVYSMWVNIADSLLSVLLVWLLIPIMDIAGYALVIVIMECFNFSLSYVRLRGRVRFHVDIYEALAVPLVSSLLSLTVAKWTFVFVGRDVTIFWLGMQILFSLCICYAIVTLTKIFKMLDKRQ